jgi:DNA-binding beta-propeller fold protein YncE
MTRSVLLVAFFATISACGGRSTERVEREQDAAGDRLYVLNFGSADISGFDVDATGALSSLAGSPFPLEGSPGGAAVAPNRKTLYVAEGAGITSYAMDAATGALKRVGEARSGTYPEVIAVNPSGTAVYAAQCNSDNGGSLSVLPVEGDNELGRAPSQSIPTTLCINGIAVDPMGRFLYVSSQYGYQGSLDGFSIDRESGTLTPLAGSPFASFLAVAIAIDPEGKHVYVCDQDALVRSYDVDARTGQLVPLPVTAPTGANPFSVAIDHQGHLLVGNWSDGSVSSYVLDPGTGSPSEAPGSPYPAGDAPHVLAIDASSRFAYINNQGSPTLEVLAIGSSGELSPMAGSPFAVGEQPTAAVFVP